MSLKAKPVHGGESMMVEGEEEEDGEMAPSNVLKKRNGKMESWHRHRRS